MYPERICFQHCWWQFVLHLSIWAVALGSHFPQSYHQLQQWCQLQSFFVMKESVGAEYCYHILHQCSHYHLLKENYRSHINFVVLFAVTRFASWPEQVFYVPWWTAVSWFSKIVLHGSSWVELISLVLGFITTSICCLYTYRDATWCKFES